MKKSRKEETNFYKAIEMLPQIPLEVKLQAQDQIRELEKAIMKKRLLIEEKQKENAKLQEKYKGQF